MVAGIGVAAPIGPKLSGKLVKIGESRLLVCQQQPKGSRKAVQMAVAMIELFIGFNKIK